jgi:nucleoside-specific outer membrane channel protein Tsx
VPCVVPCRSLRVKTEKDAEQAEMEDGKEEAAADDWVADVNGMLSFNTKFLPKSGASAADLIGSD